MQKIQLSKGMRMKRSIKNLKPTKKGELSTEEAKKRGSLGGKKSVIARNQKKTFRLLFEGLCEEKISDEKLKESLRKIYPNIADDEMTNKMLVAANMWRLAVKGGSTAIAAFKELRDTIGEQPVSKHELTGQDGSPLQPPVIKITGVKAQND